MNRRVRRQIIIALSVLAGFIAIMVIIAQFT